MTPVDDTLDDANDGVSIATKFDGKDAGETSETRSILLLLLSLLILSNSYSSLSTCVCLSMRPSLSSTTISTLDKTISGTIDGEMIIRFKACQNFRLRWRSSFDSYRVCILL